MRSVDVSWNNAFGKMFTACWRDRALSRCSSTALVYPPGSLFINVDSFLVKNGPQ